MIKPYFEQLFTVYSRPQLVRTRTPPIAFLSFIIVVLVWCSFFASIRLDLQRVYKSTCRIRGAVMIKLKGFASTESLPDSELPLDSRHLYKRIWDPTDVVFPMHGGEGETGSFAIVTNIVITANQTQSNCPDASLPGTMCSEDAHCPANFWSSSTHGRFTGKCVNSTRTCEIRGWCPPEQDILPRHGKKPLLEDVENFTVLLKNSVEFPGCSEEHGTNVANLTVEYLKNCMYDKDTDPLCPKFRIGDIVKWSNADFTKVALKGAVFRVVIKWKCDFDNGRSVRDCKPQYKFSRVDDLELKGMTWNFRSAEYYDKGHRTLKKQYGLKILIDLSGYGRKFDFFKLILTIGSTIGLFSVSPLICNILLDAYNFVKRKCHADRDKDNDVENNNVGNRNQATGNYYHNNFLESNINLGFQLDTEKCNTQHISAMMNNTKATSFQDSESFQETVESSRL